MADFPKLPQPDHVFTGDELIRLISLERFSPSEATRAQLHVALALQEGSREEMKYAIEGASKAGLPPQGWAWLAALLARPALMDVLHQDYHIDFATLRTQIHSEFIERPFSAKENTEDSEIDEDVEPNEEETYGEAWRDGQGREWGDEKEAVSPDESAFLGLDGVEEKLPATPNNPKDWIARETITQWISFQNNAEAARVMLKYLSPLHPVPAAPEKDEPWGLYHSSGIDKRALKVKGELTKSWLTEALEYKAFDVAEVLWEACEKMNHAWTQSELDRLLLATTCEHMYRYTPNHEDGTKRGREWFAKLLEKGADPASLWTLVQNNQQDFEMSGHWRYAIHADERNWVSAHLKAPRSEKGKQDNLQDLFDDSRSEIVLTFNELKTPIFHQALSLWKSKAWEHLPEDILKTDIKDSWGRGLMALSLHENFPLSPNLMKSAWSHEDRWNPLSLFFLRHYPDLRKNSTSEFFRVGTWKEINEMSNMGGSTQNFITWPLAVWLLQKHLPPLRSTKDREAYQVREKERFDEEIRTFVLNALHPSHAAILEPLYLETVSLTEEAQGILDDYEKKSQPLKTYQDPNYKACQEKIALLWKTLPQDPSATSLQKPSASKLRL